MKLALFRAAAGDRVGLVTDEGVLDLSRAQQIRELVRSSQAVPAQHGRPGRQDPAADRGHHGVLRNPVVAEA